MTELTEFKTLTPARPVAAERSRIKAAIDRLGALLGLILIAPLLLTVALLIRLDSPGPILFRQTRYGRGGVPFEIFKFRTMTAAASRAAFRQATDGDVRITHVGWILRHSGIDELPQLLNVLRGDMSLIGPRPHPMALDHQYAALIPHYMDRYAVRPGITGLAQVNGHRGPTPTVEAMATRVALDLDYIANWSLALDLRILVRTPWLCLTEVLNGR